MILIAIPSLIGYIAHAAKIQEKQRTTHNRRPTKQGLAKTRTRDKIGTMDVFDAVASELEPPP
jgi:hypothetical protein